VRPSGPGANLVGVTRRAHPGILLVAALVVLFIPSARALAPGTYCYRVAAVNAAGEGPLSNEICATVGAPFQRFVTDMQAAAYYAKWVRDNPNDSGRWFAFRDQMLAGTAPAPPVMTTRYGAGLVDAGVIAETMP
jgi:hypothetical protein